jgi:hypothetical protein
VALAVKVLRVTVQPLSWRDLQRLPSHGEGSLNPRVVSSGRANHDPSGTQVDSIIFGEFNPLARFDQFW